MEKELEQFGGYLSDPGTEKDRTESTGDQYDYDTLEKFSG